VSRHRVIIEIDRATWTEISADPRFHILGHLEIIENPYAGCRSVLEFIHRFCSENDRENFTRAEILEVIRDNSFTAAEIDWQLRKLVYDREIERVRHGHYDLGLCIYGVEAA